MFLALTVKMLESKTSDHWCKLCAHPLVLFPYTEICSLLLNTIQEQEFPKPLISVLDQRQLNKPGQDMMAHMTARKYAGIQTYF